MKCFKRLLVFAGLFILIFTNCDTPMGFGDPIDLDPPSITITGIMLANGEWEEINDTGSRIIVGPSIVFGPGAVIKGTAIDNYGVVEIRVLEKVTEKSWSTNTSGKISARDDNGVQEWEISLGGLDKGERVIQITAFDQASLLAQQNIGPETVKELSLLVDTENPLIQSISIERFPGILPSLLPLSTLQDLDHRNFDNIDYFQNERFKIKANVFHEYKIIDVRLNLISLQNPGINQRVFGAEGKPLDSGTLQAPIWEITAEDFKNFNEAYTTGRHYFKVEISATAEAGHTGTSESNITTNTLYNLCWYPEADEPFFEFEGSNTDVLSLQSGISFPLVVFDDDNISDIRWGIISESNWNGLSGVTDTEKMNTLINTPTGLSTGTLLNLVTGTYSRNSTVEITVPDDGTYKLVIAVKDEAAAGFTKTTGSAETRKVYTLNASGNPAPPCDLSAIVGPAGGAYPAGQTLIFSLVFNNKVYTNGTVSITIQGTGGTGTSGNIGGSQTINMVAVTKDNADYVLTGSWTIPSGRVYDPLVISSVNGIANVRREDEKDEEKPAAVPSGIIEAFNTRNANAERPVRVLSIIPTITQINSAAYNSTGNSISVLSPTLDNSNLRLTFSHRVTKGNGLITIRPAGSYNIPPVLTNDEYTEITNNLNAVDTARLTNSAQATHYIRTTHGLQKNASGDYTGSPDTATKYVLNFTSGISGTGAQISQIRNILNTAKFRWQEIDVTTTLVTISGNEATVHLDRLPDGRQWKIEIDANSFYDDAGNQFAGWNTGTNYTFWSQRVAEPVIRVERISNNDANTTPMTFTATNVDNAYAETVSRRNVRYRIDCETPGAVITYGTDTSRVNTITTTGGGSLIADNATNRARFRARAVDGDQNSNILDAPATGAGSLANINVATGYTIGNYLFIGDNNLYSARKDYIAAIATRTSDPNNPDLVQSARSYEGAFKTVVVYAAVGTQVNGAGPAGRLLKIEASDQEGGAVKTAGFPLKNNDMDGNYNKFFYREGGDNTGTLVWITWEIVTPFWQVSPIANADGTLFSSYNGNNNNNSWSTFSEDWQVHSYRKYGNWGIRIGNQ